MGSLVTAPTSFGKPKKFSSVKKRRTLFSVLGQITDRDMQLLLQLYEHKVLTTHQVYELHFSTHHRARKRLSLLYDRGMLDRFRPPRRPGSYPHHYVLDDRGARLVAGYLGAELKALRFRKDRLLRLSRSRYLRHLRELNGFFTRLSYECRRAADGTSLALWLGERRSKHGYVRPDGLGVVKDRTGEISFWLEVDFGTENHERLEDKMNRYATTMRFPQRLPHAVLFCFHSEDRETRARRALFNLEDYTVATSTLARHHADPLGPIWLPIRGGRRIPLFGLPRHAREGLPFSADRDVLPGEDDTGW
jgi:predicted transcriptional regulator